MPVFETDSRTDGSRGVTRVETDGYLPQVLCQEGGTKCKAVTSRFSPEEEVLAVVPPPPGRTWK